MKHKLTNNWGLKLGSLVFAFFLWIIVTNMNDPVMSYKINNVKVRFTNTNVITDEDETYVVLDNTDVIDTVTITAPRSYIDNLGEENVVAVADFARSLDREDGTVDIELSTNKYFSNIESIEGNIKKVKLKIEALKSKTLALNTVTSGTVSDGYIIGDVKTAQNQVRISGPESVINQVVKAEVEVSVTGFAQDIITDADVKLLDADGNEVESDDISMNINTVKVDVEMLETKKVPLSFSAYGTPAEGYEVTGVIEADNPEILVAGKTTTLSNLNEIVVDASALNVTGATGNANILVDIEEYLPAGIELADPNFGGKVSVTVYVEKTVDRKLELSADTIKFENIPEGYRVELVDPKDNYTVVINGLQKKISAINVKDIDTKADLSNILDQEDIVGSLYHANLDLYVGPEKLKLSSPVQVWFKLVT